ncbi:Gfo/Idh/MocA family protein [Roseibium album]|uniref:4-carboxy-2-hydroxymuconate-6-semialdehyde dehydrogenase n=1 Tax=Roseibium album TaxID=311410 RepID=A0A0M7AQB0_9HYPH|nr:Gfo/Idh/MocA family oxidoreductase [Roseibium album]CTQ59640.1 4-carboxy-2-hydroxymuconate-6-semialdehyde dehydrogenase [Roseibium album]CTQ75837.1 4-carboxy-2-hydroxymuconate-6-semialdehyde dehydrogenase [Roseibium album]CTQ76440.1 4-carboxy-2-hydroxymuconate-6-semialdehyde dehydrogenase [Roseibium album]
MNSSLRLAISGLGLVGKRHADAIVQVQGVELAAAVDPQESGRMAARERGVDCFETIDALLDSIEVDGVVLATPTPLHVDQASACVERGCPVLVEKPIGTSSREAHALVALALQEGTPLLVGHHRRYNPLIQRAKDAIEDGLIGDIRAVHGTCWFYKPDQYFDEAPWRKRSGAGPISVNLVHDIDLLRYLCGEIVAVQAISAASARGFENEDVASALLEFGNGAVGSFTVSDSIVAPWSWEFTARENPKYAPTAEHCYKIGGSEGSLSLPDLRIWSHNDRQRDWWTPISATSLVRDASDPLVNQIRHFCDVIAGSAEPIVSGAEGVKTLQVIEAIQVSAQTCRRIEIPPFEATIARTFGNDISQNIRYF